MSWLLKNDNVIRRVSASVRRREDSSAIEIMRSICGAASDQPEFVVSAASHLPAAKGIPQFLQPESRGIVLNGEIEEFFDVRFRLQHPLRPLQRANIFQNRGDPCD